MNWLVRQIYNSFQSLKDWKTFIGKDQKNKVKDLQSLLLSKLAINKNADRRSHP